MLVWSVWCYPDTCLELLKVIWSWAVFPDDPALPKVQTTWDRQVVALVELPERADVEKATILVTSKTCGEPRKNLAVGRGHLHGRPLDVLAPPLSVAVIDGGALSTV